MAEQTKTFSVIEAITENKERFPEGEYALFLEAEAEWLLGEICPIMVSASAVLWSPSTPEDMRTNGLTRMALLASHIRPGGNKLAASEARRNLAAILQDLGN